MTGTEHAQAINTTIAIVRKLNELQNEFCAVMPDWMDLEVSQCEGEINNDLDLMKIELVKETAKRSDQVFESMTELQKGLFSIAASLQNLQLLTTI